MSNYYKILGLENISTYNALTECSKTIQCIREIGYPDYFRPIDVQFYFDKDDENVYLINSDSEMITCHYDYTSYNGWSWKRLFFCKECGMKGLEYDENFAGFNLEDQLCKECFFMKRTKQKQNKMRETEENKIIEITIVWTKRKRSQNKQYQTFDLYRKDYNENDLYNLILEECKKHKINIEKIESITSYEGFRDNEGKSIILSPTFYKFPSLTKI